MPTCGSWVSSHAVWRSRQIAIAELDERVIGPDAGSSDFQLEQDGSPACAGARVASEILSSQPGGLEIGKPTTYLTPGNGRLSAAQPQVAFGGEHASGPGPPDRPTHQPGHADRRAGLLRA